MSADLTTTSFAILGQLALQDWTMYDLAAQMRRNVHFFFPRAESQIYAEPKRLVALGLATASTERTGKRNRTVYSITPAGRQALAGWLATPIGKGPQLEFEGMLRVMLAPAGTDADLARSLASVREEIAGMIETADRIGAEYLAGTAPFQHHITHRAMIHDFLSGFARLVDDWATRSLANVETWPSKTEDQRREDALALIVRNTR